MEITQFRKAFANSATSDLAYTSLLTGLSPGDSVERLCSVPLLWAAAKKAGRRTSFYSSQCLRWLKMDELLLDPTINRAVHRDSLGAPAVNDLGMDDRDLNRIACAEIAAEHGPFFSAINYNMLHFPFLGDQSGRRFDPNNPKERYLSALAVFDRCFIDVLRAVVESGQFENTAIFFTGDHGEDPHTCERLKGQGAPRLYDLRYEFLKVPFWMRLPSNALDATRRTALANNRHSSISNLDLYPTVLDLLGYEETGQLALAGNSLLEPLPAGRAIAALNSGDLRHWEHEPFALLQDNDLMLYHDLTGQIELLDLTKAPPSDRWSSLEPSEQQRRLEYASSIPGIDRILAKRMGQIGSVRSAEEVSAEYDRLADHGERTALHKLDNWSLFSTRDWDKLCERTAELIGIQNGDSVFEAGCGAGAFLNTLRKSYRIQVAGADFSEKLIEIARVRVPGRFWVADAQDLSFLPDQSYDCVVSHGVFLYLPSLTAAERAAAEMVRIAKQGGKIYIGVLNDPDRLPSLLASLTFAVQC